MYQLLILITDMFNDAVSSVTLMNHKSLFIILNKCGRVTMGRIYLFHRQSWRLIFRFYM